MTVVSPDGTKYPAILVRLSRPANDFSIRDDVSKLCGLLVCRQKRSISFATTLCRRGKGRKQEKVLGAAQASGQSWQDQHALGRHRAITCVAFESIFVSACSSDLSNLIRSSSSSSTGSLRRRRPTHRCSSHASRAMLRLGVGDRRQVRAFAERLTQLCVHSGRPLRSDTGAWSL
jgi:hypothetical protein